MVVIRVCDLCGDEAALYCASDAAFLCCKCDARVHDVNILAARHVRQPICERCKKMTMMTGNGVWLSLCNSCSAEIDDADQSLSSPTSSSSSSCISSTNCSREKLRKRSKVVVPKPMRKVGGTRSVGAVLVRWCREIGVVDVDSVVALASRIFQLAMASRTFDAAGRDGSELRMWMAASLWLSLRLRRAASFEKMRQLVEVSSVPEKMIMVGQAKIVGMMKDRKISRGGGDVVAVECWAESF